MELRQGYNFVALPYLFYPTGELTATEVNAQQLCDLLRDGFGCEATWVVEWQGSVPFSKTCASPFSNFLMEPDRGYVVYVESACSVPIVGSHDDRYSFGRGSLTIRLEPQWRNLISVPYHTVQRTAQQLCSFINANFGAGDDLITITRFGVSGPYASLCGSPFQDFDLVPGEALYLGVAAIMDVQFETY
jgi:hypothetical protein